jgi:hypothetical protein
MEQMDGTDGFSGIQGKCIVRGTVSILHFVPSFAECHQIVWQLTHASK